MKRIRNAPTSTLAKDLLEKRHACQDAGGFPEQACCAGGVADDEAAVVEARTVFGEPGRDEVGVGWGEEVGEVAAAGGWGRGGHGRGEAGWGMAGV